MCTEPSPWNNHPHQNRKQENPELNNKTSNFPPPSFRPASAPRENPDCFSKNSPFTTIHIPKINNSSTSTNEPSRNTETTLPFYYFSNFRRSKCLRWPLGDPRLHFPEFDPQPRPLFSHFKIQQKSPKLPPPRYLPHHIPFVELEHHSQTRDATTQKMIDIFIFLKSQKLARRWYSIPGSRI